MQENIRFLEDIHIIDRLRETPYPPESLFIRGSLGGGPEGPTTLGRKFITIVGSRNCSEYGKQVVDEICKSLQGQNISIISGLANGIDVQAHKCALKYNLHTIAVLGCGLSEKVLRIHSNYRVAQKILDAGGALISEYEPLQTSRTYMFPARNRIMVGMSDLIIVIEAKEKSGTRITARLATDYNRDLLVIPNSIYSHYSSGSNELIKQGAYMYTKPEDIFNLLNLTYTEGKINSYIPNSLEKEIFNTLHTNSKTTQEIIEALPAITVSEIIQALLNLEIEEVVKRVDGKYVVL
jgi:DNA processing protein